MWEEFTGNGLFVFSDPAGAKACLALDAILKIENVSGSRRLYSNKEYSFYGQFGSIVEILKIENITNITEEFDWIFAGTSHPDSSNGFELYMLKHIIAKKSFSFIDHWTNFALRFHLNNIVVLPTAILVLDEKAKELAMADGLPENILSVFRNPYLTYLEKYTSSNISKELFCEVLGISAKKSIVLYAPDPISLRSNNDRNEIAILKELIEICGLKYTLLAKLHPLQPPGEIGKLIDANHIIKVIEDNFFLPQDIFKNVDCIIGFHSNFLLEASTTNKNIIRYILNSSQIDYLSHTSLSKSIIVSNKKELSFAIKRSCA